MPENPVILCVNDHEGHGAICSRALRDAGFRVMRAANGANAIEMAAGERPALVVVGAGLQNGSSGDVCRRLESDPRTSSIPVLFASAVEPEALVEAARALIRGNGLRERGDADEALRDAQQRFRGAFAEAAIGFVMISPQGRYVDANPAYCELTGYSLEELKTLDLRQLIHPDDVVENRKLVNALIAGERGGFVIENRYIRKDKAVVWVRKSVSLVRSPDRTPRCLIVLVENITERKRTEEALRRRTAELDSILMNAPFGFAFFDREHRYVRVNRELCRMNGIGEEAHLGRRVAEVLPAAAAMIDPLLDEVFASGNAIEREVSSATPTNPDVKRHWHIGFSPVFDDGRGVSAVGAFLLEITERKQAEFELRKSRDLLGLAQSVARAGSFDLDLKTGELSWSGELRQLYGLRPEDPNPGLEAWAGWILPEDRVRVLADVAAGISSGEVVTQFRIRRRDTGEVRWIERRGRVWRDDSGAPARMVGFSIDITEQKKAEEDLRHREARQSFLADLGERLRSLSEPPDILKNSAEALARYLGLAEAGFAELPADKDTVVVKAEYCDGRMPDGGAQVLYGDAGFGAAIRSAQPLFRENAAAVPLTRGGRPCCFLYALHPERRPWPEEERRLMIEVAERTWVMVERVQAEARLRESEARFRSVFESNMIGVVFADPVSGEILDANGEYLRIIGRTREELLAGKLNWKNFTSPASLKYEEQLSDFIPPDRRVAPFEKEYVRPDGTRVPVIVGGSFLDQTRRRVVAFVLDNSERKRNEERLKQMQKLESVGLLAGGIAHDFNNLLTGILGNASLALYQVGPGPAERINEVVASAERAAHLTRQLLAYAGKGQYIVREIDVAQAVQDASELMQFAIPKSAELAIAFQKRLPPVRMDPSQLQQILMNLVSNAGEAIGEGNPGKIAVVIGATVVGNAFVDAIGQEIGPGRYVSLEVRDTGCGIDEEMKPKLFDPFFTTKFMGRGLGLSAVAGIVRSQHGGIVVESEPGRGSTFRVLLPVADDAQERPQVNGRATVLVVDDEPSVRDFIATVLRRRGYHVLTAVDGRDALAVLSRQDSVIDALVLDVVMPVMSANELLPALQARRPNTRVLLTSGYSESEARRLCAAYPGAAFIQKPYTAEQIANAVEKLLGAAKR